MADPKETGSLHANIQGKSGVSNWADQEYLVEEKVFLGTENGEVAIEATEDGKLRVAPRAELEDD